MWNDDMKDLALRCGSDGAKAWTDWRWQIRHSVRSIGTFERVLDIRLEDDERAALEQTLKTFPLCVTPYYLSLIDREDFRNDPVFKQSFPSVHELDVSKDMMSDRFR